MAINRSIGELTERILVEVQSIFPDSFPNSGAGTAAGAQRSPHERLRERLVKLLEDAGLPGDTVAEYDATLMMVQLRGMEQLTQTFSAAIAVGVINRFLAMMSEIARRHQGTIERLSGTGMRAVFGAPQEQAAHIEQAVACAVSMQQAMGQFNRQNHALGLPEFYAGVVIESGTILAGPLGGWPHRQFGVLGEEVSRLARMEAHTLRGQILLGESAYDKARDFVLVGEARELNLAGRAAPLKVYDLLGSTRPRAMTVPRREQRKSPRVAVVMPCYYQRQVGTEVLTTVHCGDVIDLGYHGLQMTCAELLEPGATLRLELSPFLFAGETTWVLARVISIESAPEGYRCGLEFLECDGNGQRAIRGLVDSLVFQG